MHIELTCSDQTNDDGSALVECGGLLGEASPAQQAHASRPLVEDDCTSTVAKMPTMSPARVWR